MTDKEIITGNDEICQMLGWESNKVYVYKVPNLFPFKDYDSGWIELNVQQILFHADWNMLIGAYNVALNKIQGLSETAKGLLKEDKNFIVSFGAKNFFGLFENQLHISSSWVKLVDFSKWYNQIKHFVLSKSPMVK